MRSKMIIGILIVLIGLSILIKAIFKVDIPIFRIAVGIFLVYLGLQFIFGWPRWHRMDWDDESTGLFVEKEISVGAGEIPRRSYTVVFGRTTLDLTSVKPVSNDVDVEFNVVFGHGKLKVAPSTPVEVDADVAFGSANLPGRSQVALGKQVYRSDAAATAPHLLRVRTHVVFGSLDFEAS